MKAFVLYWNESFEAQTGFAQNQEVDLSEIDLPKLSEAFDVAILNNGNGGHRYLAIDAKYKAFRR